MMKKLFTGFAGAFCAGALCAADPLSLDSDTTVDVPSGTTVTYSTLSGGAYTLTKTGGGTLVFETLANASAKVVVSAGTLDVRTVVPAKPAILSSAYLHLDATDLSTMTYTESDGVTYVSQWRDVNEGAVTLNTGYSSNKPFLAQSFRNGRSVMDLGAIRFRPKGMDEDVGYGAYFLFNSTCSNVMREAFLVVGDTEDAKRSHVDYGKPDGYAYARCAPLLGTMDIGNVAPFVRGSIEGYKGKSNSTLIYNPSTPGASECAWTLNGTDVADETAEILPDGLNLVEIRVNADSGIKFNSLGTERRNYYGGLRYGELVIFDAPLTAADRAEMRAYLSARWLPVELAGVELGEGTSLALANDVTLRVGSFKASGTASVTGGGALKIVNVDRSGDGSLTFAQSAQTIRPDASGILPGLSFPSGGSVDTIGVAARAGCLSVSGGTFVKKGDGSLTVMDIADGAAISVEEGTFAIDPQVATDNSWLHLDANIMDPDPRWIGNDSGTNTVLLWPDIRGTDVNYARQETTNLTPWLIPDFTNGLSIVDFGGYKVGSYTPNARGAWMYWHFGSKVLRDVFTVASDTEDLDWNYQTITNTAPSNLGDQARRGAPFVGNQATGYSPHFLRDNRPVDGSSRPKILKSNVAIYNTASVMVDGESVDKGSAYPAGLHVVNICPGMDAHGHCFANDRSQITGGTRIGEFVAFTNEVSSQLRDVLNRGLMSKWLGGTHTLVRACGAVSVAQGATLEAPHQTLAPTGQVSIDGAVSTRRLALSGNARFGVDSSLSGDLELSNGANVVFPADAKDGDWTLSAGKLVLNGGTVRISFAAGGTRPASGTKVKLVSFDSVEGSATITLEERRARAVVANDGLYAEFLAGMTVSFY